jgi:hypothetical protein
VKFNTEKEWTEATIDDDCNFDKFYIVADILEAKFNLSFSPPVQVSTLECKQMLASTLTLNRKNIASVDVWLGDGVKN